MVAIPGGTFAMGSCDFYPEEQPVRTVAVDAFLIDEHPVTVPEFRRFLKATGHLTLAETAPDAHDYPDVLRAHASSPTTHDPIPRRVIKGGSHLCAPNYCLRYRPAAGRAKRSTRPPATSASGASSVRRTAKRSDRPSDRPLNHRGPARSGRCIRPQRRTARG